MNKKLLSPVVIVLLIICVVEVFYVFKERGEKFALGAALQKWQTPSNTRPKPSFVLKGDKFSDSPLFSKAYLIFPVTGTPDPNVTAALTGWTMTTITNRNGSVEVDLIPKEAEDIKQTFIVKKGFKLYFIEMTLSDDQTGVDMNRGDDIGVLIDQDGIVQ